MTSGKIPFLLITLLWITACSASERDIPETPVVVSADSIIAEQVMIRIIADVQIIESALLLQRNRGEEPGNLTGKLYRTVFSKYGINRSIYEKSIRYYQSDQEHFAGMYNEVGKIIERQIDSLKQADSAGQ